MRIMRVMRVVAAALLVAASLVVPLSADATTPRALRAAPGAVRVDGNRLVRANGHVLHLVGVNRSGTEYACVQGWGIFDGPSDVASVAAIRRWGVNVVRVPLNEDCWLGINGVNPSYSGRNYRSAIAAYVRLLHAQGMAVDLELHWNAPGTQLATGQQVMADADHSPAFWRSVTRAYRDDPQVLFELYNEPHDITWDCWLHGCDAGGWQTAGMQDLVDAVRSTGATNVILAGGLGYSSDLSRWLGHRPHDPLQQLAAAFHTYNFSGCNSQMCWDDTVAPVSRRVPVVMSEFGENDCAGGYVIPLLQWADAHHLDYLAWTWDTWDCSSGPALITNYDGTPTTYGATVKAYYLS